MTNNFEYYPISGVTITSGSFESFFSGEGSVSFTRSNLNPGLSMTLSENADIDYPDIYKISLKGSFTGSNQGYYDANNTWVSIPNSKITSFGDTFIITDPQVPSDAKCIFIGANGSSNTLSNFAIYDSNDNNITLAEEHPEDTGLSTANMLGAYVGSQEVTKIYLGTEVLYQSSTPTPTGDIHLTSDGLGIVFPAGTYTSTDGNNYFTIYNETGQTDTDSITFTEDATFPYQYHTEDYTTSLNYMWEETNREYKQINFTVADGLLISKGSCSSSSSGISSWTAVNAAVTIQSDNYEYKILKDANVPSDATYNGKAWYNGCKYSFKLIPEAAAYSNNFDITMTYSGTYGGSSSPTINGGYLLQIRGSDGTVKETIPYTSSGSTKISYTHSVSNHAPLSSGDYFFVSVGYYSTSSGAYNVYTSYSTPSWKNGELGPNNNAPTIYAGYNYMGAKVVKLGLSGTGFEDGTYFDREIRLAEDTNNGWNLGYVKFSDSEVDKLVQYSKTPIT